MRRILASTLLFGLLVAATGCTKEAKKIHYLSRAKSDFAAGKYEAAEIEYRKVLQVAPANPTAISQLGVIYFEEGRFPQALAFLKKAVELVPENLDLRVKLCLTELSLRQVKDARSDAEVILKKQPGQEDALSVLADSTVNLKEVQDTIAEIESLRKHDQDRAGYHLALGALYLREGQLTNGVPQLTKALELDPKSAAAQMAMGNVYWMSNDLVHAEQAFKTGAELSPIRSARRIKYADFKLKTGSVEDGKKILEEMTQKAPDYVPAWIALAQVAYAQNKLDDCAALLQQALAKDNINYEATLLDVNVKLNQNHVPQAIAELLRLAKVYAHSPELQLRLAQCYFLNGEQAKGELAVKQALALDPSYPDAIIAQADLSVKKGDPVSAELALEQLLRRRPDLAQAHLLLAAAYASQQNLDQALIVYRRMQKIFPKSPQVPFFIGSILARQNQTGAARQACEQSLALAPDFLPPLELLVDLDIADKKFPAALDRVNAQIKRRPEVPQLQLLLAKVYFGEKDYTNTEAALLKAIKLAPGLDTSYLLLSKLYIDSNKTQEALARLNAFVAQTNDVSALMQIGMIQESLTNYPAARDAYEKLLSVNPRFGAALNNLAYLYCERFNQLDQARKLAEQARQLYPADPSVADTLGWIVYRQGDYPRALSLLTQAAGAAPDVPEIQCHLGMVRYQLGQEAPARLALQNALEGKTDFLGKEDARRCLAILNIAPDSADPAAQPLLEKRLAAAPNDPVALVRLAAIYSRKGELENAAKAYQQALVQSPGNPAVLASLARLYSAPGSMNDAKKALEYAKDAHGAAPDDDSISQLLGHLVCQTGDYKWASSLLQDVAIRSPNQPAVLYDLARANYGLGQLTSAQTALQNAINLLTSAPNKGEGKGEANLNLPNAQQFLTLLTAYLQSSAGVSPASAAAVPAASDPNYIPVLMVNSVVQQQKGDFNSAKATLEQVLSTNPLFTPASRDLAVLCFAHFPDDSGTYDLAMKARQTFPDDPNLAKVLGVLAYRRANYSGAVHYLGQAVQSIKSDADAFYYLGMAQYQLKSKSASKASLQQALTLNLEPKLAADARRLLAELK